MQLRGALALLLLIVAVASMPQTILSAGPPAITQTASLTPLLTLTSSSKEAYCGIGLDSVPFTGSVHIDFQSTYPPFDFYVLSVANIGRFITMYYNSFCKSHPSSTFCNSGECVYAQGLVTGGSYDVKLPIGSKYVVLMIQFGLRPQDLSLTIIAYTDMNGVISSKTSVTVTLNSTTLP